MNPSYSVPTLVAENGKVKLTQSIAILEYLEEKYPDNPLLPKDLYKRSIVRNLVNIFSCDVQPVTNLRILKHVVELGGNSTQWSRHYYQLGLNGDFIAFVANKAYEALVKESAGVYSVGDNITMADIVLAPAVEGGLRSGVDFNVLPTVYRIYERIKVLPAFEQGDWKHQEDTPEQSRC